MNTSIPLEWDVLGDEWRAAPESALPTAELVDELHRRVRRRSRQRIVTLALEVLLTVAAVWWSLDQLAREGIESWVPRFRIFAFIGLVWGFGLWSRRHGWRAEGRSTADFMRLARQRLAEGRQSIRFVYVILGVVVLRFAQWIVANGVRGVSDLLAGGERGFWLVFTLYLVAMFGWCAWYARWIARETEWLDRLQRDLE